MPLRKLKSRRYFTVCTMVLIVSIILLLLNTLGEDMVVWIYRTGELFADNSKILTRATYAPLCNVTSKIATVQVITELGKKEPVSRRFDVHSLVEGYENETTLSVDTTEADKLFQKVKILCIIMTTQKNVDSGRIKVLNATWTRRCNKAIYALCTTKAHEHFFNTCQIHETYRNLYKKERLTYMYIYANFLQEYNWFLKGDDDTYIVMENLRFFLQQLGEKKKIYSGFRLLPYVKQGYLAGGSGYVLDRRAFRILVEKGFHSGLCDKYLTKNQYEDVEIGKCLETCNVSIQDPRDVYGRDTFHPESYMLHVTGDLPNWLQGYTQRQTPKSVESSSQFPISYHHMDPYAMIALHHLLYRTSVYGRKIPSNLTHIFPHKDQIPK